MMAKMIHATSIVPASVARNSLMPPRMVSGARNPDSYRPSAKVKDPYGFEPTNSMNV